MNWFYILGLVGLVIVTLNCLCIAIINPPAGPGRYWWQGCSFGKSSAHGQGCSLRRTMVSLARHWVWGFPGEVPTDSLSEHCTVPSSTGQVRENHPTWLLIPFRDRNTSVPLQFPSVSGDQGPLQLGLPPLRTPENCFFHLNGPSGRWVDFQKHRLAPMTSCLSAGFSLDFPAVLPKVSQSQQGWLFQQCLVMLTPPSLAQVFQTLWDHHKTQVDN